MNTQELAQKMVELHASGATLYDELYHEDAESIEMPGGPSADMEHLKGVEAIRKKSAWWYENNEVHSSEASEPLVADGWFAIRYTMDVTEKSSGQRYTMSEIGVFHEKDGKVVREQYFYSMDM